MGTDCTLCELVFPCIRDVQCTWNLCAPFSTKHILSYSIYIYLIQWSILFFLRNVQLFCRATSTINGITYLPWSDSDLSELRKITPLPQDFEDPKGLPQLSMKQKSNFMGWMRPYDICDNPEMVHLISSFSIKQVNTCKCI